MRAFPEWLKLPAAVQDVLIGSEDYLTSRTFGILRYCSAATIAGVLRSLDVALPVAQASSSTSVELWPMFPHKPRELSAQIGMENCEPDVVILAATFALVVETKFRGSRLGHYHSQLGREWLVACELAQSIGWSGHRLMMVTPDNARPLVPKWGAPDQMVTAAAQISGFLADMASRGVPVEPTDEVEIERGLVWVSWAQIARAISAEAGRAPQSDRIALKDCTAALEIMGCTAFDGWHAPGPPMFSPPNATILLALADNQVMTFTRLAGMPAAPPATVLGLSRTCSLLSFAELQSIPVAPQSLIFGGSNG
jgi:hypothetical protein